MALDITDKTVFWGAVASNYYWGRLSGMEFKDTSFPDHICYAFKVKRGSKNTKANSGPTGKKARKTNRSYKNSKLMRLTSTNVKVSQKKTAKK